MIALYFGELVGWIIQWSMADLADVYAPLAALLGERAGSLTATLDGDGVAVFDGALGSARCNALRTEIDGLHKAGYNLIMIHQDDALRNRSASFQPGPFDAVL